jgi:hypothetical protein
MCRNLSGQHSSVIIIDVFFSSIFHSDTPLQATGSREGSLNRSIPRTKVLAMSSLIYI